MMIKKMRIGEVELTKEPKMLKKEESQEDSKILTP